MAQTYKQVQRTTTVRERDPDEIVDITPSEGANLAARLVSLAGGVIMAVLAMRFLLSLFGANRGNVFADLVYNISYPFVAPFFGLFNYTPQFGAVRFEFETLIATMFWGFMTWLIVRLITIGETE